MIKKTQLKKQDKDELINLIVALSRLNEDNEVFIKTKLHNEIEDLIKLSHKKLDKAFCCFENLSLRDARKVLTDFRKLCDDKEKLLDLYFYYINCANDLDKHEWRLQENFYNAIERVFTMIFGILREDRNLFGKYKDKLKKTIKESNEGWGLRDFLVDGLKQLEKEHR